MSTLSDLQREGKIRAIGVCNVSPLELDEYAAHGTVSSVQFRYSMLHREAETELLPRCKAHDTATLTYMSLEQGLLTGKVSMDTQFPTGDFRTSADWNPWYLPEKRARILTLLGTWKPLCAYHGCSLAQLVLAWTLAQDGITHILAGARHPAQILETEAASDLELQPDILSQMRNAVEALDESEEVPR
jgi:aryl-alcohol dehydrogenase-like predicted oxidoreductase